MPPWGKAQNDDWDKLSGFIYDLPFYEEFIGRLNSVRPSLAFNNYAVHRWFNYWSANAVEQIFCANPAVLAQLNGHHKLVDFTIGNISFDHKTTVFPKGFHHDIAYAKIHPHELITWLYRSQSKEGRYHTANRLFLVLHHSSGEHWKLRRELNLLKPLIDDYVKNFNPDKLFCLELIPGKKTYADIIWFEQ